MKKKLTKLTAFLLVVGFTISSITGCSKGETSSSSTGSSKGDTIKVGVLLDQSGENAQTASIEAYKMAFDEINEAGGVLGKQIEPIVVDGQSDTQKYQEMAKKLVLEDNVDVCFSSGTSASREAIRPIFDENKKLYIYPTFYEGGVADKYTYCTGSAPEQAILPLLKYVKENNLGKKVYILAADYNFGQICSQWVQKYCSDLGIEIVGTEYVPLGVSQFNSSISKIQESGADTVYTLLVGSSQFSFFEQWGTAGLNDVRLISTCNIAYSYDHKRVEAPILNGMLAAGTFFEEMSTETQAAKEFVGKFRSLYPDETYIYNEPEAAYSAVYLWKKACEEAKAYDTESVIKAFQTGKISFDAPSGKITIDGTTNHAKLTVTIAEVQKDHSLKFVNTSENVEPTYLKDLGIDLTKKNPAKQFSPLDED